MGNELTGAQKVEVVQKALDHLDGHSPAPKAEQPRAFLRRVLQELQEPRLKTPIRLAGSVASPGPHIESRRRDGGRDRAHLELTVFRIDDGPPTCGPISVFVRGTGEQIQTFAESVRADGLVALTASAGSTIQCDLDNEGSYRLVDADPEIQLLAERWFPKPRFSAISAADRFDDFVSFVDWWFEPRLGAQSPAESARGRTLVDERMPPVTHRLAAMHDRWGYDELQTDMWTWFPKPAGSLIDTGGLVCAVADNHVGTWFGIRPNEADPDVFYSDQEVELAGRSHDHPIQRCSHSLTDVYVCLMLLDLAFVDRVDTPEGLDRLGRFLDGTPTRAEVLHRHGVGNRLPLEVSLVDGQLLATKRGARSDDEPAQWEYSVRDAAGRSRLNALHRHIARVTARWSTGDVTYVLTFRGSEGTHEFAALADGRSVFEHALAGQSVEEYFELLAVDMTVTPTTDHDVAFDCWLEDEQTGRARNEDLFSGFIRRGRLQPVLNELVDSILDPSTQLLDRLDELL